MKLQFMLAVTAAATASAQYTNQTDPFFLQLKSSSAEVDGSYLYACHAGAAIEGLCLGGTDTPSADSASAVFYHNYSSTFSLDDDPVGYLTWNLPVNINGSLANVSSPMSLAYSPVSNVAIPEMMPQSYGITTLFDSNDRLAVVSSGDDSSNNSTRPAMTTAAWYNWYACYAFVGGYYYHALAWVTAGEPHNPSCAAVDVVRMFV